MFLSCKVHPPTADVALAGGAALFLGKKFNFPASKPFFVGSVREYSGFCCSQGVQFANGTGFVRWEELR